MQAHEEHDLFRACARLVRMAVTGDVKGLARAVESAEIDIAELAAAAGRLQAGSLLRRTLAACADDHPAVTRFLHLLPPGRFLPAGDLLPAWEEIAANLGAAGIDALLIKGLVLGSRLYGDIDRRPQYDLDVLVHRGDARAARRHLRSMQYQQIRRDGHSRTFRRGAIHVDLHHALRTAPAYRLDEGGVWHRAQWVTVAERRVATAADEDTLTLLAASLVEDVGFGMAKLKNVTDVWLLIRHLDPTIDWDRWLEARRAERLEALIVNACVLALLVFGWPGGEPRIAAALDRRTPLSAVRDEAEAITLMVAPRASPANLAWFGRIYPGSLARYRLHTFVHGFPATLKDVDIGRQVTLWRAGPRHAAVGHISSQTAPKNASQNGVTGGPLNPGVDENSANTAPPAPPRKSMRM